MVISNFHEELEFYLKCYRLDRQGNDIKEIISTLPRPKKGAEDPEDPDIQRNYQRYIANAKTYIHNAAFGLFFPHGDH